MKNVYVFGLMPLILGACGEEKYHSLNLSECQFYLYAHQKSLPSPLALKSNALNIITLDHIEWILSDCIKYRGMNPDVYTRHVKTPKERIDKLLACRFEPIAHAQQG